MSHFFQFYVTLPDGMLGITKASIVSMMGAKLQGKTKHAVDQTMETWKEPVYLRCHWYKIRSPTDLPNSYFHLCEIINLYNLKAIFTLFLVTWLEGSLPGINLCLYLQGLICIFPKNSNKTINLGKQTYK